MRFSAVILCVAGLALAGCDVPQEQKIADCTTNYLDFQMTVQSSDPYQFVLGVPHAQTGQLGFHGVIDLRQGTRVVAQIPINSQDVTSCDWLPSDVSGYILTWSRTNHGERISDVLHPKQTYDVHVTFDVMPPPNSSLWLSSMKR